MAAISAVFILDAQGRVLIFRDYRGDVPIHHVDRFMGRLAELEEEGNLTPVVEGEGVTYVYLQHSNIYLMAVGKTNFNAMAAFLFLHRLVDVFAHYFEELEEESVQDNFVTVYELLDEVMDFGYPQYTEGKILSEFIHTESHRMEQQKKPPMAVTNAVSWRSEGLSYKKNEVFLDVVESVNLVVNPGGGIVHSEITGALKMRAYLSGMPECKLGLNDKVMLDSQGRSGKGKSVDLEDIKFHQCVRLSRFENDRTISFIPPDGAFDLMTYRINTQVKPLIWVECMVDQPSRSRMKFQVKAHSQFKERSTANNVVITVPFPADATSPQVRVSLGSAEYCPEEEAMVWTIKNLPGGKQVMLKAEFSLPSVSSEEPSAKKRPISVKFEIPYFTVSGIQVRYLKVIEKSGYQALPWVRYITGSGEYEIRLENSRKLF